MSEQTFDGSRPAEDRAAGETSIGGASIGGAWRTARKRAAGGGYGRGSLPDSGGRRLSLWAATRGEAWRSRPWTGPVVLALLLAVALFVASANLL